MRDNRGGALTYEVVAEELDLAADAVREITSSAQQCAVDTRPQPTISTGLGDASQRLCGRRDLSRSHLLGDSTAMADS